MSVNPVSAPFRLHGIDHIVFVVDDLDRAVNFYATVLGCEAGYSYPDLGMEQVWCGSSLIVLWDHTHPGGTSAAPPVKGGRNLDHVCIATGPFEPEALRDHLTKHGVQIEREAQHGGARGLGHSFYFRDPFNNLIELKGPPEHPENTLSKTAT